MKRIPGFPRVSWNRKPLSLSVVFLIVAAISGLMPITQQLLTRLMSIASCVRMILHLRVKG